MFWIVSDFGILFVVKLLVSVEKDGSISKVNFELTENQIIMVSLTTVHNAPVLEGWFHICAGVVVTS